MFTGVCLSTGECLTRYTPHGTRYTPSPREQTPQSRHRPRPDTPQEQTPPGADTHPRSRHTPPGADTHPPEQTHTPGADTPLPEQTPPLEQTRVRKTLWVLVDGLDTLNLFLAQNSVKEHQVVNGNSTGMNSC